MLNANNTPGLVTISFTTHASPLAKDEIVVLRESHGEHASGGHFVVVSRKEVTAAEAMAAISTWFRKEAERAQAHGR